MCLDPLQKLFLNNNEIGDDGVKALASAISSGALPNLTELYTSQDAPALKAACEARNIEYY